MQYHASELDPNQSVEHAFFKSLLLKFDPSKENHLCGLLPKEEGEFVSKLKAVPLEKYPNLIEELIFWHPDQRLFIERELPKYLHDVWKKMLNNAAPDPFIPKFIERIIFGVLVRSGANRASFVEKSHFLPLLKASQKTIELLFQLISFRLMMQSSQFLIEKQKRQAFFKYVLHHPQKKILQSYFKSFSQQAGQLKGGARFTWNKWNGESEDLQKMERSLGIMSLGVCIQKGTNFAFLLSKRLRPKEADILSQNALPSSIPSHLVKDMQTIVFDSMQFIQKNEIDQMTVGERAHV